MSRMLIAITPEHSAACPGAAMPHSVTALSDARPAADEMLRELVTRRLSLEELRAVHATGKAALPTHSWSQLVDDLTATHRPTPSRVVVAAPAQLSAAVQTIARNLSDDVVPWNGREQLPAADVLVAALPWRGETLTEAGLNQPGQAHLAATMPSALLPVSFTSTSVTVGPFISAKGPCLSCVAPALAHSSPPDEESEGVLTAFAAGAVGLFLRTHGAQVADGALSLTFSAQSPEVIHRLWTCTPTCQLAA